MTTDDRFLLTLETWLEAEGGDQTPAYVDELLVRTAGARQLPAWASLERWLPAWRPLQQQVAGIPRAARLLAVAALILALVVAVLAGSGHHRPAPPFGLAANGSLVMASMDEIVIAGADGSNPHRLIGLDGVEALAFSPDGSTLAYRSIDPSLDHVTVLALDLESGRVMDLAPGRAINSGTDVLAWAPDGSAVVTADGSDGVKGLLVLRLDGSPPTQLVPGRIPERRLAFSPAWSPDGQWIAFIGRDLVNRGGGLFVVRRDGTDEHGIAAIREFPEVGAPHWSPTPDRLRLLFVRPDGFLGLVDLDGGEQLVAETASPEPHWPTWSPDGTSIAWFDQGLLVGRIDDLLAGGSPRRLSTLSGGCRDNAALTGTTPCGEPVWSPDGRWIVGPDVLGASMVAISVDGSRPPIHIPLANAADLTAVGAVAWQRRAP